MVMSVSQSCISKTPNFLECWGPDLPCVGASGIPLQRILFQQARRKQPHRELLEPIEQVLGTAYVQMTRNPAQCQHSHLPEIGGLQVVETLDLEQIFHLVNRKHTVTVLAFWLADCHFHKKLPPLVGFVGKYVENP